MIIAKRISSGWWNSYYSISQRVDLNIEHISQVFMKRGVFYALKSFGVLIDGSVPTSLTKNFPLFNVQYCLGQSGEILHWHVWGFVYSHSTDILLDSFWLSAQFFLPNIQ